MYGLTRSVSNVSQVAEHGAGLAYFDLGIRTLTGPDGLKEVVHVSPITTFTEIGRAHV